MEQINSICCQDERCLLLTNHLLLDLEGEVSASAAVNSWTELTAAGG